MKSKRTKKTAPKKPLPLASSAATIPVEVVPPGLEYFAELKNSTPRKYFEEIIPELKNAGEEQANQLIEALAGALSGFSNFDFGVQVPEWVKTASKKVLELLGIDFNKIESFDVAEIGKIIGLMESSFKDETPQRFQEASANLSKMSRAEAATLNAKEAREFFTELEKGQKIPNKIEYIPKRIKVIAIISMAWRRVETFENAGQLHRWLLEINAFDGSITDSAETRKICRIIGLKYNTKAGKPPKLK